MYCLKDKKLHEQLDAISNGEFTKKINWWMKNGLKPEETAYVTLRENPSIDVFIKVIGSEIESEYNPHGWNNFPEVTPPEGVMMRLELTCLDQEERRYGAYWSPNCNSWIFANGDCMSEYENKCVIRFRSWDDEE